MTLHMGLPEGIDAATLDDARWSIAVLDAAQWPELRTTRLRALAVSPDAFVATHAEAIAFPEEYWRDRIESSTWLVAREQGDTIGLARLRPPDDEPPTDVRYIESVWVDPGHRCRGVLRSMVEELEWIALATAVPRLRLWVLDTNPTAWDAYLKLGFSPEPDHVKATTKSDGGRPVLERRMVKEVLSPRAGRPLRTFSTNGVPLR